MSESWYIVLVVQRSRIFINSFDPFCSTEELQVPLQHFLLKFLPKVRVIRTPKRLGLMSARIFGVEAAVGQTYTFLDSHCECTEGKVILLHVNDWSFVCAFAKFE